MLLDSITKKKGKNFTVLVGLTYATELHLWSCEEPREEIYRTALRLGERKMTAAALGNEN